MVVTYCLAFGDGTDFIAYFGLGNFTTGSWNHIS